MAQEFDLYKLLVEEVRETRKARRDMSNVFTTINLAGVGALASLAKTADETTRPIVIWAGVALILTCLIWRTSNAYYTKLLNSKYQILYEMETALGPAKPLAREYELMKGSRVMRHFSLERMMPTVFILGYLLLVLYLNQALINGWFDWAMAQIKR